MTSIGARYRCPKCDISFSRVDSLQHHLELIHGSKPIHPKKILILGGGFAGVEVLRRMQDRFQNDVSIDITIVSKDNFFLFTPMLHEVASGMIETRHIVTPIRAFCNRAKFYSARVELIDLKNKQIVIGSHSSSSSSIPVAANNIGATITDKKEQQEPLALADPLILSEVKKDEERQKDKLSYDYLVIALGSETKFFGMADIEKHAFTIKSWNDAIIIRNHVLHKLEQAELLLRRRGQQHYDYDDDNNLKSHNKTKEKASLLTFVIVGGGFAGVETAGELNDFLRDSVKDYYHNIEPKDMRSPYQFIIQGFVIKIMLSVSCREVGMDCDYVCKGETEQEIMKNAEEHAMKDHGYKPEDLMTPELREKIRSHIKSS